MRVREVLAAEIAEILGLPFFGDNRTINGLIKLVHSHSDFDSLLTFCGSSQVLPEILANPRITTIVTKGPIYETHAGLLREKTVLISETPIESFYLLHRRLWEQTEFYREYDHPSEIGTNCSIHPSAIIEAGVRVGNNVSIGPFCLLKRGTVVGDDCVVEANTVIGSSGFEIKAIDGIPRTTAHVGGVKLGRNVEIGAGCVIDRALFERATIIGDNTKIDNLVQIAHNCTIGSDVLICAQAQISGSVSIGERCYLAPSVCIRDQIRIAPGIFLGVGAVVTHDLTEAGKYVGVPARLLQPGRQGKAV